MAGNSRTQPWLLRLLPLPKPLYVEVSGVLCPPVASYLFENPSEHPFPVGLRTLDSEIRLSSTASITLCLWWVICLRQCLRAIIYFMTTPTQLPLWCFGLPTPWNLPPRAPAQAPGAPLSPVYSGLRGSPGEEIWLGLAPARYPRTARSILLCGTLPCLRTCPIFPAFDTLTTTPGERGFGFSTLPSTRPPGLQTVPLRALFGKPFQQSTRNNCSHTFSTDYSSITPFPLSDCLRMV